jgi:hypothetical protein
MGFNEYRFKVAIGSVWSSWGFRHWNLLFGSEMIVPYPYKMREVVWLLTNYYFKRFDADPGMQVRKEALAGVSLEHFMRERDAHRIDQEGGDGVELYAEQD